MLRNSFIDQYKPKSTKLKFLERDLFLFQTNSKIIHSHRPMSTKEIKKFPPKVFSVFIDDIMCNSIANTLLYNSNAKKETYFYIKQKKALLNINNLVSESLKQKELSKLGALMLNKNNLQKMQSLKDRIKEYLDNRDNVLRNYKIKKDILERTNINIDFKNKKLFYKPMNDIRLEGYKRALNNCLRKSKSDKYFELPNNQLNMENVFSRLSKNIILDQKTLKQIIQKEKEKEQSDTYNIIRSNQIKNFKHIPNQKLQSIIKSSNRNNYNQKRNIIIRNKNKLRHKNDSHEDDSKYNDINLDLNKKNNFDSYHYNIRNMPSLNLTKLLKFSSGKEFIIKITPRIIKRCLSALSCGPKPRKKKNLTTTERKDTEEIDYDEIKNKSIYDINNSRKKENINNIILYNTLRVEKNFPRNNLVKLKNFRDENFNSNLHIAVLNDSIKLVKYFIDRKLNLNTINNEGKTPLHLAMKKGNIDIIELLIENGANTKIKDKKGKKPIDYASREIKRYFKYEDPK